MDQKAIPENADARTRTGTPNYEKRILSPLRLPFRHIGGCAAATYASRAFGQSVFEPCLQPRRLGRPFYIYTMEGSFQKAKAVEVNRPYLTVATILWQINLRAKEWPFSWPTDSNRSK